MIQSVKPTIILFYIFIFSINALAQKKLSTKSLQKDLTIIKDIAIGSAPMLTDETRTGIENQIQLKVEELEGQSLDVIGFLDPARQGIW